MVLVPTSKQINQSLSEVVEEISGAPARPGGPVNSDGYSFLRVGVPATTIGTYDRASKDRGFHGPADNLERVVMERLPEAVRILARFVESYDKGESQFPQFPSENVDKIYKYPQGEPQ